MDNFDLRKFLAEGKLHEAMFDAATTERIAQQVADAFTAEDSNDLDLKYVVSPGVEAGHFDLDVEAGPNTPGEDWKDENGFGISNYLGQYAGGSFLIRDGIVINAAMRSAPVARVTPEGEVEIISAEESRAAIGMEEIEEEYGVEGPEAADIDAIADEPISEYTNKMKKSELKEGIIDVIKDKIASVGKKLLDKFSPEEQASMKAAAEKVLGPNYSKEDITLDKAKEIGKLISGGLDESQELDENLRKKIGASLAGLGMSTAFVAGNAFGDTDAGAITAGIGVLAAVVGMLMANIEEGEEPKSSKMKKSELKEMIRAAFLNEAEGDEEEDVEVDTEEEIEDVDVDVDADVEDTGEMDVEDDAKVELTGDKAAVSDNLEAALEAARALGDEKLVDQIGNTITFFTRAHIVKEETEIEITVNGEGVEVEEEKEEVNEGFLDFLKKKKAEAPKEKAPHVVGVDWDGNYIMSDDPRLKEEKEEINESFNRMQRLAGLIK